MMQKHEHEAPSKSALRQKTAARSLEADVLGARTVSTSTEE